MNPLARGTRSFLPAFAIILLCSFVLGACASGRQVDPETLARGSASEPAPAEECADDPREEDDERLDTAAHEKMIWSHAPTRLEGMVSCPGDDDWIHAYADCCDDAGVELRWNAAEGDLKVDLFDAEGRLLVARPGDIDEREEGVVRRMRASHGGDLYVRIRNRAGTRLPYTLTVHAPQAADP